MRNIQERLLKRRIKDLKTPMTKNKTNLLNLIGAFSGLGVLIFAIMSIAYYISESLTIHYLSYVFMLLFILCLINLFSIAMFQSIREYYQGTKFLSKIVKNQIVKEEDKTVNLTFINFESNKLGDVIVNPKIVINFKQNDKLFKYQHDFQFHPSIDLFDWNMTDDNRKKLEILKKINESMKNTNVVVKMKNYFYKDELFEYQVVSIIDPKDEQKEKEQIHTLDELS